MFEKDVRYVLDQFPNGVSINQAVSAYEDNNREVSCAIDDLNDYVQANLITIGRRFNPWIIAKRWILWAKQLATRPRSIIEHLQHSELQ